MFSFQKQKRKTVNYEPLALKILGQRIFIDALPKSPCSTNMTERSSSLKKIMIPKSQKLAKFFDMPRAFKDKKSVSTSSLFKLSSKDIGTSIFEGQHTKLNNEYMEDYYLCQATQRTYIRQLKISSTKENKLLDKHKKEQIKQIQREGKSIYNAFSISKNIERPRQPKVIYYISKEKRQTNKNQGQDFQKKSPKKLLKARSLNNLEYTFGLVNI